MTACVAATDFRAVSRSLPSIQNKEPRTNFNDAEDPSKSLIYLPFFALNFAHLARCAAAILSRAAAESLRVPPPPPELPATPLNAAIALSNFARSAFNWATIAPRSAIRVRFLREGRFDYSGFHHTPGSIWPRRDKSVGWGCLVPYVLRRG